MRSIAIITTQAFSLVNFRGPLIRTLVKQGVLVFALAPDYSKALKKQVAELGAEPVEYSLSRTGTNPLLDTINIFRLAILIKNIAPEVTLSYFIKPVIYGSIAAWLAKVPKRFSLIEGLGYVFLEEPKLIDWRRRMLRRLVSHFYKFALGLNKNIFFLNKDDISQFVKEGVVSERKVVQLDGIGLDLYYFNSVSPVLKPITFVLIARMLREKGVYEYVEAARQVRMRFPSVRFLLIGGIDQNPNSVKKTELEDWVKAGIVEWPGLVNDVRPWLAKASVLVLPSYYREGLPRSNQEAMAMGRPVITTDSIGCRETVKNGINGFLVPVRDSYALAQAMFRFIKSPNLIEKMGQEGRTIAEKRFDVHAINRKIIEILQQ